MKPYTIIFAAALFASCGTKEKKPETKWVEETSSLYYADAKPFYHGVASGDPLQDRVILWTRVTPDDSTVTIKVKWEISTSLDFSSVVKSDSVSTSIAKDFTVKVDAGGLQPSTKYFYRFSALGAISETGETKTLPSNPDSVKLAVVSCANWEWGFLMLMKKFLSDLMLMS